MGQPCAVKGISSIYWGESHRPWGMRQNEHQNALRTRNLNYATFRHSNEMHPGASPLFTFHYEATYATSLERQIRESLVIESSECDIPLNGKGEWGTNIVPRANFEDPYKTFKLNRNQINMLHP